MRAASECRPANEHAATALEKLNAQNIQHVLKAVQSLNRHARTNPSSLLLPTRSQA
jgi:hypothetical protein